MSASGVDESRAPRAFRPAFRRLAAVVALSVAATVLATAVAAPAQAGTSDISVVLDDTTSASPVPGGVANVNVNGTDCGTACVVPADIGDVVFAFAESLDPGWQFVGWGATPICDEGDQTFDTCEFVATGPVTLTARFAPATTTATLSVVRSPSAGGSVAVPTSTPAIACGSTCSGEVGIDDSFTLTATPASGYAVTEWDGVFCDEFPVGPFCTVSGGIAEATTVTVTFTQVRTVTIAAAFTGAGGGSASIDWEFSDFSDFGTCNFGPGSPCAVPVPAGLGLTLTAQPGSGVKLTSWSGVACSPGGSPSSCSFTPSVDVTATANFTVVGTSLLTVKRSGALGTVEVETADGDFLESCSAADLAAPAGCGVTVDNQSVVRLVATSEGSTGGQRSVIGSWTNCAAPGDSIAGETCLATITAPRTVTVVFDAVGDGQVTVVNTVTGGGALPNGALVTGNFNGGIDCGRTAAGTVRSVCSQSGRLHDGVTLFIQTPPGWQVTASGCDQSDFGTCGLYLETASTVTLTWTNVGFWPVTVTTTGAAAGDSLSVFADDRSATCPAATGCTVNVTKGQSLQVNAATIHGRQVAATSTVAGCTFSGSPLSTNCFATPTGGGTVSLTWSTAAAVRSVGAQVNAAQTAGGSVSLPGTPSCSGADTCTARNLTVGSTVTVSAGTATGWTFASWTNCPSGSTSSTCTFTVTSGGALSITANFTNVGVWRVSLAVPSTANGDVYLEAASSCGAATVGGAVNCFLDVTKGNSARIIADADNGYTAVFAPSCTTLTGFAICTVVPTANTTITTTFSNAPVSSVTIVGTPSAGVALSYSYPGGFVFGEECGSTCVVTRHTGTQLEVDASTISAGYALQKWDGCDQTAGAECTVGTPATALGNRTVTASMLIRADNPVRTLTLQSGTSMFLSDMGPATFDDYDSGVFCSTGETCSRRVFQSQRLDLTSFSPSAWTIVGATAVPGTCTVGSTRCRIDVGGTDASVTTSAVPTLTVTKQGSGTVTSSPAGISCGTTCTAGFASGTSVKLTAAPAAGSVFSGWSGSCSGTATTCTVSMTAARSVTARFGAVVTVQAEGGPGVTKAGAGWSVVAASAASGGKYLRSKSKNASLTFAFTGTSITVFRVKGADKGKAAIYLDGVKKGVVNDYAKKLTITSTGSTFAGLASKAHTVKIVVLKQKGKASKPKSISVGIDRAVYIR